MLLVSCGGDNTPREKQIDLNVPGAAQRSNRDSTIEQDTSVTDTAAITHTAELRTTAGVITLGLFGNDAPLTVTNFIKLAESKYYDGVLFHRVAKGFVIQAGDPFTKDSTKRAAWGTGGNTYTMKPLPDETNPESKAMKQGYSPGILAMANKMQPNTGTSQFFICLDAAGDLAQQFSIFGKVLRGMDAVKKIEQGEADENDGTGQTPKNPVRIISIRIQKSIP